MHKDIVSIIAKLLKRCQMYIINKQYHTEYSLDTGDIIRNRRHRFMFNYRRNIKNRYIMIYNMVIQGYTRDVCRLPKNYF